MTKLLLITLFTFGTIINAQAKDTLKEVVTCNFTEPFVLMVWNPNDKTITHINSIDQTQKLVVTNPHIEATLDGVTLSYSKNGRKILIINNKVGNNGMSDHNYPMEGLDFYTRSGNDITLYGGCSTPKYQPWGEYEMINDIIPDGTEIN